MKDLSTAELIKADLLIIAWLNKEEIPWRQHLEAGFVFLNKNQWDAAKLTGFAIVLANLEKTRSFVYLDVRGHREQGFQRGRFYSAVLAAKPRRGEGVILSKDSM